MWTVGVIAVFGAAGAVVWAGLGAALGPVPNGWAALAVAAGYALLYGIAETARYPLRRVGLRAQVPSSWIRGRRPAVQVAIWGALLGPGLVTHNPYAGMWIVPFMLALTQNTRTGLAAGAAAGLAHGVTRAAGVLRVMPRLSAWEHPAPLVLAQMRWRAVDGAALALLGGMLVARLV